MVQKEINSLSGKLERVFMVTDEQVFKVLIPQKWIGFCKKRGGGGGKEKWGVCV